MDSKDLLTLIADFAGLVVGIGAVLALFWL